MPLLLPVGRAVLDKHLNISEPKDLTYRMGIATSTSLASLLGLSEMVF